MVHMEMVQGLYEHNFSCDRCGKKAFDRFKYSIISKQVAIGLATKMGWLIHMRGEWCPECREIGIKVAKVAKKMDDSVKEVKEVKEVSNEC